MKAENNSFSHKPNPVSKADSPESKASSSTAPKSAKNKEDTKTQVANLQTANPMSAATSSTTNNTLLFATPKVVSGKKIDPKNPYAHTGTDSKPKGHPKGRIGVIPKNSFQKLANFKKGDHVTFPLFDSLVAAGKINLIQPQEDGLILMGGELNAPKRGSFSIGGSEGKLGGMISFENEPVAYKISTKETGDVVIEEKLISELLCIEVDRQGKLLPYPTSEKMPSARLNTTTNVSQPTAAVAAITVQVLDSLPSASAVLYLDFDGETVTDPNWNKGSTIFAQAYNLDSSYITTVWEMVSEDFSPFNISVTTNVNRYNNAPSGHRMRCIITPTDTASPGNGGVAYLYSFRGPDEYFTDTIPCWAFNSSTPAVMAMTISHEFGHTLGLSHDGNSYLNYYEGHGSGLTSWGPIMGAPFNKTVIQWSKGEYYDADNIEDDLAIIASTSGVANKYGDVVNNQFGYRVDDYGNTRTSAFLLQTASGTVNQSGVIEKNTDSDYFRIDIGAGEIDISLRPQSITSPNLDTELQLEDSSGGILATSNPDDGLSAPIKKTLSAGTYYLRVKGVGMGNPLSTGYTNYGSIGRYTLKGTLPILGNTPPTIVMHPRSQTVLEGASVDFNVIAAGTEPFTYKWQKNNVNIAGATSSTYTIPQANISHAGGYSVIVTNSVNSVTSNTATLTVNPLPVAPTITTHPQSQTVTTGVSVSFSVTATGTAPLSYQWLKNEVNITGATGSTYTISNVASTHAGNYQVIVRNSVNSVTSNTATLTVNPLPVAPTITAHPQSQTVTTGVSVSFSVTATGTAPLSYQWQKNGNNISGATGSTYTISNVANTHAGNYQVVVRNSVNSVTSNTATLIVNSSNNPILQVAAGGYYTLALKRDGTLWAWGANYAGQLGDETWEDKITPIQIGTETNWTLVAAGASHTAALKSDGTLWAWGGNWAGQLGDGTLDHKSTPVRVGTETNWDQVAAGWGHTLAIKKDGTLWAWGYNRYGQLGDGTWEDKITPIQIGTDIDWSQVVAGNFHSLGIKSDGTLWAWGKNDAGQLGNGTWEDKITPVRIGTETNWIQVAAGNQHSKGIKSDGSLWTWGVNWGPQFDDGSAGRISSPMRVGAEINWKQVAAGPNHTIGIKKDGTLWAWGDNNSGQLGDGTTVGKNAPVQIGTEANWMQVAAGDHHTIAFKSDGKLLTWGYNMQGQLGNGVKAIKTTPIQIGSETNWAKVATRYSHTIALKNNGTLWAWGNNRQGQLGDGTIVDRTIPIRVDTATNWKQITVGYNHTLALKNDGTLWAWGANYAGQLGDGTDVNKNTPIQVGTEANWMQVIAGGEHTLALKNDGTLWAWGKNDAGQLGDGTFGWEPNILPIQVGTEANWVQVAAGLWHTVATKSDGTLWAWGNNEYGQLGDGTFEDKANPVRIGTETNWIQVAAGQDHSLGIKSDGTLWAWGRNSSGQLGDGTWEDKATPVQVDTTMSWARITAGFWHTLATKKDGTLWAWGSNWAGQFGNGTRTSQGSTLQIGTLTNWVEIAAGIDHSVMIKSDGTLWACGSSLYGQLGDGIKGYAESPQLIAIGAQAIPPTITAHPQSLTANVGALASFSVTATGTAPLSYQWLKNEVNITGATGSTYTISNIASTHAGNYRVIVKNSVDSITSNTATLTVNSIIKPTITAHPVNLTVNAGTSASFSVTATGTAPLSYQWQRDNVNIPGRTSATLYFDRVESSYAGTYSVVVTNAAGSVTSNPATLTVNNGSKSQQITGQGLVSAQAGQEAVFSCKYGVSDNNNALIGISIRVHYNSSRITKLDIKDVFTGNASIFPDSFDVLSDTNNFDGDPLTDKYIILSWINFNSSWPNTILPVELFKIGITLPTIAKAGDETTIHFSSQEAASGYTFQAFSPKIQVLNGSLDIDGNGLVGALTDGILLERYLLNFTDANLIKNAIGSGATRTTATAIKAYLQENLLKIYDIDGNGLAGALTDGILMIRYLLNFSDANLIKNAIGSGATRTTATAIKAYLQPLIPPASTIAAISSNITAERTAIALTQEITSTPEGIIANPGENFKVYINYNTGNQDNTLGGLYIGVFWDSSKLEYQALADISTVNANIQEADSAPSNDTENFDGDANTDKVIYLRWVNFNDSWPNVQLPVALFSINFKALALTDTTAVRFAAKEAAVGYQFWAPSLGIKVSPAKAYDIWRKAKFAEAAIDATYSAPDMDPDKDGLPNLLEYAIGNDPLSSMINLDPLESYTELVGEENHIILKYMHRKADTSLGYEIQRSSDLINWIKATPLTTATTEPVDADFERLTLHFKKSTTPDFYRLVIQN